MVWVCESMEKVVKMGGVSGEDEGVLKKVKCEMVRRMEYGGVWMMMGVGVGLGMGRMIGWGGVGRSMGEKMGKKGMR